MFVGSVAVPSKRKDGASVGAGGKCTCRAIDAPRWLAPKTRQFSAVIGNVQRGRLGAQRQCAGMSAHMRALDALDALDAVQRLTELTPRRRCHGPNSGGRSGWVSQVSNDEWVSSRLVRTSPPATA